MLTQHLHEPPVRAREIFAAEDGGRGDEQGRAALAELTDVLVVHTAVDLDRRAVVEQLPQLCDAVAVGGGTARADRPRLDAREVDTPRGQPRRLVFSRSALPDGVRGELEVRSGPLDEELRSLAADGVQTLLLEGGPTLAAAFFAADLVDKILVFVAPLLGGDGPGLLAALPSPRALSQLGSRRVGDDVLLEAYVHEP